MKYAKRISALICVFLICFTLVAAPPPAHAAGTLIPQNFGAWISAGLMSLNIIGQSLMPAPGPVDPYFQWLSSPASYTQEYQYPVGRSMIQEYLNASTIKVNQGVTTIDGVEYDEVFVEPGTFTSGLKTNLFDFKTKWNILSGQSGIVLAEGAGTMLGNPVYNVNGTLRTSTFSYTVNGGDYSAGEILWRSSGGTDNFYIRSYSTDKFYGIFNSSSAGQCYFLNVNNSLKVRILLKSGSWQEGGGGRNSEYVSQPFKYGYTSGVVPGAQSDIPSDYGLSIQIPHDQLQTFYNTYPQYNVDNSVINIYEDQIDIDQLTQAIFDQINSMEDIRAEWKAEEEPEPEPPGPAEDVLTGVNTIIGQQNTQISQNQQDLQIQQQQLQQQQQINDNTSSIKESIDTVVDTPTAQDLPDFKFDLRELFPFCIPFDIYNMLSALDAEPVAPHVQLPFVIESLNFRYNIDLDFSVFDPVAQVLRTMEFIVYGLGLAWATGKVIKW